MRSVSEGVYLGFPPKIENRKFSRFSTFENISNPSKKTFEISNFREIFDENFSVSCENFRRKFRKFSKIFENLFEKIKNAQNRLIRWENRKKNFHFEPKIVEKILVAVNIRDAS